MGYSQLLGQAGSVHGARLALEQMRREREAQRYAAVNQALGTAVSGASTGMLSLGQMLDQMEQRKSAQERAAEQLKYDRGRAAEQMRYDRGKVAADNRYTDAVDSARFNLEQFRLEDARAAAKHKAEADQRRFEEREANEERRSLKGLAELKQRRGRGSGGTSKDTALLIKFFGELSDDRALLIKDRNNRRLSITKNNEGKEPDEPGYIDEKTDTVIQNLDAKIAEKKIRMDAVSGYVFHSLAGGPALPTTPGPAEALPAVPISDPAALQAERAEGAKSRSIGGAISDLQTTAGQAALGALDDLEELTEQRAMAKRKKRMEKTRAEQKATNKVGRVIPAGQGSQTILAPSGTQGMPAPAPAEDTLSFSNQSSMVEGPTALPELTEEEFELQSTVGGLLDAIKDLRDPDYGRRRSRVEWKTGRSKEERTEAVVEIARADIPHNIKMAALKKLEAELGIR